MTNYCEGCKDYAGEISFALKAPEVRCCYTSLNHDGECPCRMCIVKVMCSAVCETFVDFTTPVFDFDDFNL